MRIAESALWTNGGFEVTLQMPGLAESGTAAEELGLATPQFQELPVGPAAWRKAGTTSVLLIAGSALGALVAAQGAGSVRSLIESAAGVVVGGVPYRISGCEPLSCAGAVYAYRVSLTEPVWS